MVERFIPTKDPVRWEIDLDGQGPPWTTAIQTRLRFAKPEAKKFWTTWGDSRQDADPAIGWVL